MIEVLKQAIEALEYFDERAATINEIQMARPVLLHLRQAIRELESQEPVCPDCKAKVLYECVACSSNNYPPQRKPLTEEQIFALENSIPDEVVSDRDWCIHFARAIEAKIKENT